VKGLSLSKALLHFARSLVGAKDKDVSQKGTETSLIEQFLYPKLGPGQMWEYVASQVVEKGGELHMNMSVTDVHVQGNKIVAIEAVNTQTNEKVRFDGDYFFSTMPMRDLVRALHTDVPPDIKEISEGLVYRDFITVGVLVKRFQLKEGTAGVQHMISDNWIYIQEPDVMIGRLQIFNNWSPYLVADQSKVWLGLEYFCDETDDIWTWDEQRMIKFAGKNCRKSA